MARSIPYILIWIRLLITIALFADSLDGFVSDWFVPSLCFAVFLDMMDGALARWLGVVTQRLREADSTLDFFMMVAFAISSWLIYQAEISHLRNSLIALIAVNVLSFVPAIIKFGSLPPYHTVSARTAGAFMFVAAFELFSTGRAGLMMNVAIFAGILSHIDRVTITFILPSRPDADVNGIWHALKIRSRYMLQKSVVEDSRDGKTFKMEPHT